MDAFYTYVITAHQYGVDVPRARWNELTDAEKRAWGKVVEEQVEQAAIGLWGAFEDLCWVSAEDSWKFGVGLGDDPEAERRDFRKYARAALKAARGER